MAKRSRRGVKTYRPYGINVFLYALFALAVVAGLAAFVILPMFTFTIEGEAPIVFNGFDYITFSVRRFFSSLAQPKFDTFVSYFATAEPSNQLLEVICKIHGLIELIIGGLLGLAAVWALIEALLALGFMMFGQSAHPKSLDIFAWLTFWFFALAVGLSYLYFFFYMQIIESTGNVVKIQLSLEVLAIIAVMFVLCIILLILFRVAFKDRVAYKGKKKDQESAIVEDGEVESSAIVVPTPAKKEKVEIASSNEEIKDNSWTCPSCGAKVNGKFCPECGAKKPEEEPSWTCECGAVNKGKFCPNCGKHKPEPEPEKEQPKAEIVPDTKEEPIAQEVAPVLSPVIEEKPTPAPKKADTNILPKGADVITVGDRAYAKNTELTSANIPEGIVSLGSSAFANCLNLGVVTLPSSLQEIGFNCFFNTPKLVDITYNGTVEMWKTIKRGSNWLTKSGTKVVKCTDGQINVNPRH